MDEFLDAIIPYIHEHYREHITLDELAELEHVSKSYLTRRFKQFTGMTIVTYINRVRLEAARDLLATTHLSTNEIAYQTGFESPKYFFRVFKKEYGESPSAFRKTSR